MTELEQLREWKLQASLLMSALHEEIGEKEDALKQALPWLLMVAQQKERPDTSSIHEAVAAVRAAISQEQSK